MVHLTNNGAPNKNKVYALPRGVTYSPYFSPSGVEYARLNICWHDTVKPRKFSLHLAAVGNYDRALWLHARNAAAAFREEFYRCAGLGVRMDTSPWQKGNWRNVDWPLWISEDER